MECLLGDLIIYGSKTATACCEELSASKWTLVFFNQVKWVSLRVILRSTIATFSIFVVVSAPNWPLLVVVFHDSGMHILLSYLFEFLF